ncbi:MAG: hypothetical protein BWX68_02828 [Verrucomicrobia bacterium ADurb.Bin063]|jgi:ParB family chromosome partitioning protein|nr:MAG: hypothetical protein BWX68_02828 [Verrucomicrobia bacterium ADurb.Bin063]
MSKAQETAAAGLLRGIAYGKEQAKADRRLAAESKLDRVLELVPADAIRPRAADSRPARAEHVLEVAESVAAVGLLQPPAIDNARRLVAGLHRLEGCRLLLLPRDRRLEYLLALDGGDRLDPEETADRVAVLPAPKDLEGPLAAGKVPCRVLVDLDAERDPAAALAAEAAENTARKDYTPAEVQALAQRLRAAGYRETGGRPRRGEKALRPALEMVLGVSKNTARRMLGRMPAGGKGAQVGTFSGMVARLDKALDAFLESDLPEGVRLPGLRRALGVAKTLAAYMPEAKAEAKTLED